MGETSRMHTTANSCSRNRLKDYSNGLFKSDGNTSTYSLLKYKPSLKVSAEGSKL